MGCVIFQLLTGNSPFRAASEYLTFTVIQGHCDGSDPLKFPDTIGNDAVNIISLLLSPEPADRLGAGLPGTGTDAAALRGHSFFQSEEHPILWGHLLEQAAPYLPDPSSFPSTMGMRDGADDEWLSDGEATPIVNNPIAYKKGKRSDSDDVEPSSPRGAAQSTRGGSGHPAIVPLVLGSFTTYMFKFISID